MSSIDCYNWEGVSCDDKGQVTQILLPSKGLRGNVSPFLGNLTHLSPLNLSPQFTFRASTLPDFFLSFNQLRILDLSYNYLGGNISLLFSSNGWPNYSSQIVDISSNDSNGMIQASFFQLARILTKLNVSNNSFTGPIPSLPCINSPFVMLLDFSSNNHSGQIHSGLRGCSKLQVFRAGSNSVTHYQDCFHLKCIVQQEWENSLILSIIFQVLLAMTFWTLPNSPTLSFALQWKNYVSLPSILVIQSARELETSKTIFPMS